MNIRKNGYYFIGLIISLYLWILILYLLETPGDFADYSIRLTVLFGFTSLFIAGVITPFMKQIYKMFGTSFLNIHHIFSVIGLILITIHPLSFAIVTVAPEAFIPRFDSWIIFWELAGRPALYLIYIAVIAAILRKKLSPEIWRILHGLNYVALIFAYFHGVLIGTDFQNLGIMITFTAMFVITMEVLIYRRFLKYKLNQKKSATK